MTHRKCGMYFVPESLRLKDISELQQAAANKQSLIDCGGNISPAAWIMNKNFGLVYGGFRTGLYIYDSKHVWKVEHWQTPKGERFQSAIARNLYTGNQNHDDPTPHAR